MKIPDKNPYSKFILPASFIISFINGMIMYKVSTNWFQLIWGCGMLTAMTTFAAMYLRDSFENPEK